MGSLFSTQPIIDLTSGISKEDAERLWQNYSDEREHGTLSHAAVKKLLVSIANDAIKKAEAAKEDPKFVDALVQAFDTTGDGRISREEFMAKAMKGFTMPLILDSADEIDDGTESHSDDNKEEQKPCDGAGEGLSMPGPSHTMTAQAEEGSAVEPAKKKPKANASAEKELFKVGMKVKIVGITHPEAKALEGWKGIIVRWSDSAGRWMVKLNTMIFATPSENIEVLELPGETTEMQADMLAKQAKHESSVPTDQSPSEAKHESSVPTDQSPSADLEAEVLTIPGFTPPMSLEVTSYETGEGHETELYSQRSKLYRFCGGDWKERGLGPAKLLRHAVTGKVRFLFRQEDTWKVVANHCVIPHDTYCNLRKNGDSEKMWVWSALDWADGHQEIQMFALKFGSSELASRFKDLFDQVKQ